MAGLLSDMDYLRSEANLRENTIYYTVFSLVPSLYQNICEYIEKKNQLLHAVVQIWGVSCPEWHLEDLFIIRPLQRIMSCITRTVGYKYRIGT